MPRMSWPNRITIVRILLIAPFVICLLGARGAPAARWAAVGLFAVILVLLSPALRQSIERSTVLACEIVWWLATGLAAAAAIDYVRLGFRFVAQPDQKSVRHAE